MKNMKNVNGASKSNRRLGFGRIKGSHRLSQRLIQRLPQGGQHTQVWMKIGVFPNGWFPVSFRVNQLNTGYYQLPTAYSIGASPNKEMLSAAKTSCRPDVQLVCAQIVPSKPTHTVGYFSSAFRVFGTLQPVVPFLPKPTVTGLLVYSDLGLLRGHEQSESPYGGTYRLAGVPFGFFVL